MLTASSKEDTTFPQADHEATPAYLVAPGTKKPSKPIYRGD